jgi:hypothetical protein
MILTVIEPNYDFMKINIYRNADFSVQTAKMG